MARKRLGRPPEFEGGHSQNIYLPFEHRDYLQALADANYMSFSAVVRIVVERDMRAHGGKARVLA